MPSIRIPTNVRPSQSESPITTGPGTVTECTRTFKRVSLRRPIETTPRDSMTRCGSPRAGAGHRKRATSRSERCRPRDDGDATARHRQARTVPHRARDDDHDHERPERAEGDEPGPRRLARTVTRPRPPRRRARARATAAAGTPRTVRAAPRTTTRHAIPHSSSGPRSACEGPDAVDAPRPTRARDRARVRRAQRRAGRHAGQRPAVEAPMTAPRPTGARARLEGHRHAARLPAIGKRASRRRLTLPCRSFTTSWRSSCRAATAPVSRPRELVDGAQHVAGVEVEQRALGDRGVVVAGTHWS